MKTIKEWCRYCVEKFGYGVNPELIQAVRDEVLNAPVYIVYSSSRAVLAIFTSPELAWNFAVRRIDVISNECPVTNGEEFLTLIPNQERVTIWDKEGTGVTIEKTQLNKSRY